MRACTKEIFSLTWDQEGQRIIDPSLSFYEMLGPVTYKENCCIEFFVSFSGPLKVTILYPCDHFWKTKPALTPVFSLHCHGDAEMLQALNSLTGVLSLAARAAAPSHTAETKGKSQPRATSSLLWLHQGSSVVMSLLPLGLESVSLIRIDTDIKNNHLSSVALTGHWICM